MTLTILADDFTGACDAAASFAGSRSTSMCIGVPDAWPANVDVLAVDLDLREQSDSEAHLAVSSAVRRLGLTEPTTRVYVKIDSTLRGPIAGLVAGALEGSQKSVAVVAPAFPEQCRLIIDGRLSVDGRTGASLLDILGPGDTALVGVADATTADDVASAVDEARMRGASLVVVDSHRVEPSSPAPDATREHGSDSLQAVADAWERHPEWLLVGSAGLARRVAGAGAGQIAEIATSSSGGVKQSPVPLRSRENNFSILDIDGGWRRAAAAGSILVIAGSPAAATRSQLEHLGASGLAEMIEVPNKSPWSSAAHVVVLCTKASNERDSGESARTLAQATAELAVSCKPGGVILTGGQTARLVCQHVGAHGVRLLGELEPGVPIGHLIGGLWDGVPVITKAGGFGTPSTLLDAARAFGVLSINPGTGHKP